MDDRIQLIPPHTVKARVQILGEKLSYNHRLMNIPAMWTRTQGEGIKVAILDTGCPAHVDLNPVGSWTAYPGYTVDENGHSTHCGGIIAAIANNGIGVAGIAPGVKDYYGTVIDRDGSGTVRAIVEGIYWAVDAVGVDVISMSLGIATRAPIYRKLEKACNYAAEKGVAVFAAAGNEFGKVGQPALYDSVIAVAAVNNRKEHADFSNIGPEVEFASGGVEVYSTYLNNSYAKLCGTSMACPAVAAVGALILSDALRDGERLTPDELRIKLRKIAYDVGADGFDELYGHGIPIFGPSDSIYAPEHAPEPVEPPDLGKKIGIRSDCATWRLIYSAIAGMAADLDTGKHIDNVIADGIKRVAGEVTALDRLIKAREKSEKDAHCK